MTLPARVAPAVLAAALAILASWGAWDGYFLMDDWGYVNVGEEIAEGGLPAARLYAARRFQGLYRPVPDWLNAADFALFGRDARGWLATNALLHAGCAALVAELAWTVAPNAAFAAAAGALFATAPAAATSAAVVSLRMNSLSTLLALAALLAAFGGARPGSASRLAAAAALAALAMLSKETAVVLPALAAALLLRRRAAGRPAPRPLPTLAAFALPAAAVLGLRVALLHSRADASLHPAWDSRLPGLALQVAAGAARGLFGPLLADARAQVPRRFALPEALAACALGALALREALRPGPGRSALAGGLLWCAFATAPLLAYGASGLLASGFPPGDLDAPHRLYLAAVGAALAAAAPLAAPRSPPRAALLCALAAAVAAAQCADARLALSGWAALAEEPKACWRAYDAAPGGSEALTPVFEAEVGRDCRLALVNRLEQEGRSSGEWAVLGPDGRVTPSRRLRRPAGMAESPPEDFESYVRARSVVLVGRGPEGAIRVRPLAP